MSVSFSQIIADHTVVDRFDDIPQYYINEVKKMWLVYAGESHSSGIRDGLRVLESSYPSYAVSVVESGTPEAYTTTNLRASSATWGDYSNASGWIYDYGEEDWWTNATAIARTKAGLLYCKNNGPALSAFGFGWCWDAYAGTASANVDPVTGNHWYGWSGGSASGDKSWGINDADNSISGNVVNMDDYITATQEYINYCKANNITTKVFFTTGPVDNDLGTSVEARYQAHLKYEQIRNYVNSGNSLFLFDFADILCYDNNGTPATTSWNGKTFPTITSTNALPVVAEYHISSAGALRLAKALWWMLARMAGWDGISTVSTWQGGTTDWSTPANWSGGFVPTSSTDVIIPATGNNPVISALAAGDCHNLTVNAGASLTIESSSLTSSGSLIVHGTAAGTVVYNRFMRNDDRHFFSSPVGGSIADFESAHSVKVYEWDEEQGIWDPTLSETEFLRGKGYAWDQNAGSPGTVTFTGTVVTYAGPITATAPYTEPYISDRANWGGGGWNLLGNPFTSPLSAAAFTEANSGSIDPNYMALYVYDGPNMQYKWASSASPVPGYSFDGYFGPYVQAGQGFFIIATRDGVQFAFNSGMQGYSPAVPMMKSAGDDKAWPGLQLKVSFGEKERSTVIAYNNEMTTGLDPGYDIGQLSTGPDVEIYTLLAGKDNSVNFAQQALPMTGISKNTVPVGIDSEKGGEVTFSAFTVPPGNIKFWLEDRATGIFTDLNLKSYTVTLPSKTYGTGRFFIHASVKKPAPAGSLTEEPNDVRIWSSADKVIVKGEVSSNAYCTVFSMRGEKIIESGLGDGGINTITVPSASKGIFLVRVTDGIEIYTGKVIIL
jgi:hypothetical protein